MSLVIRHDGVDGEEIRRRAEDGRARLAGARRGRRLLRGYLRRRDTYGSQQPEKAESRMHRGPPLTIPGAGSARVYSRSGAPPVPTGSHEARALDAAGSALQLVL